MKKIDPSSRLKNIKAVREMLEGKHSTQTKTTVGYRKIDKDKTKKREVGEVWEEQLPDGSVVIWEQKEGYRVKTRKNLKSVYEARDYLRKFPNCMKDICDAPHPREMRLDEKYKKKTGRCTQCQLELERQLKINGSFENYAEEYMKKRIISFLEEAEVEKEYIKQSIGSLEFVNVDGFSEKWDITNKAAFIEKIDKDFENMKQMLLKGRDGKSIIEEEE